MNRIKWSHSRAGHLGRAGDRVVFAIRYSANRADRPWTLMAYLPGTDDSRWYDSIGEAEAAAEGALRDFVVSLGFDIKE